MLDHVARAAQRLVQGGGKPRSQGNFTASLGKWLRRGGEGEYKEVYLEIKGNKVVSH